MCDRIYRTNGQWISGKEHQLYQPIHGTFTQIPVLGDRQIVLAVRKGPEFQSLSEIRLLFQGNSQDKNKKDDRSLQREKGEEYLYDGRSADPL